MTVRSADVSAFYELIYNPKYTPKRSERAHVEKMTIDGEPKYIMIKEPGQYFEIDDSAVIIWNLLDGNRTLKQVWEDAVRTNQSMTEKDVKDTVLSFAQEEFLESTEPEIEEKRIRIVSAVQLDIRLIKDASITFRNLFKITRKLIKKNELPIALAITVLGLVLSFPSLVQIFSSPTKLEILGSTLFGLFLYQEVILVPMYAVHELAHAAVCDYEGAKPREIGTGFYYFAPFFFCDTSDGWRLSRRARIMISLAGPLSTLLMGSLFTFLSYLPNLGFGRTILQVAAFFCFYGTLINFSPVIETDGYYILSDLLDMPNLRDESFGYLKRVFLEFFGRPVKKIRYALRRRRILLIYSTLSVAWIIFFVYTTVRLTYFYSLSANSALIILFKTATGTLSFSLVRLSISIGSLLFYFLLIAGYFIMGVVYYQKLHVRGVKLETIHDKRVSVFLPIPAYIRREQATQLLEKVEKVSRKFSRSASTVFEAPFCVAALKLGKVDQSLEDVKKDMASVEKSFRSIHDKFIFSQISSSKESEQERPTSINHVRDLLTNIASQFPTSRKSDVLLEVRKFLNRQDKLLKYVLQASYGNVWTLELPPDDYRRIRRELFPSFVAEELSATDLDADFEDFKRHTILGLDALANLSSELSKESSLVMRNPGQYQATAFIEPIRNRLIFMGRTEGVERSIVWIGGLFLYQSWTSYISTVLYECAIGLGSLNRAHYASSFGKPQIARLSYTELESLSLDIKQLEQLRITIVDALSKIRSSCKSAQNFHETLITLLEDQSFDIGLYEPILLIEQNRMKAVEEKIRLFEVAFEEAFDALRKTSSTLSEQLEKTPKKVETKESPIERVTSLLRGERRGYNQAYLEEMERLFAMVRFVYPVILESNVVI